jgi:hypothetical protein
VVVPDRVPYRVRPVSKVRFFGQFLVASGVASPAAIAAALSQQAVTNLPLGALALARGLLSERQVLVIHTEQRRTDKRFGELAVAMGFLRRQQLDELLREQAEAHLLLGEALVQGGSCTRAQLDASWTAFQKEQAGAEEAVRAAVQTTAAPQLVAIASDVTGRMLLRMGKLPAKLAAVDGRSPFPRVDHALWLRVDGDKPFTYLLGLTSSDLLALARCMLEPLKAGELPDTIVPLVLDVGRELVLATVGQIVSRLAGEGWRLRPGVPDVAPTPPGSALQGSLVLCTLVLPHGGEASLGLVLHA